MSCTYCISLKTLKPAYINHCQEEQDQEEQSNGIKENIVQVYMIHNQNCFDKNLALYISKTT